MKFFTNKKFLFKLIATLCVCLTILNFCAVPKANAEDLLAKVGGKILDPVCDLLLVLGDGVMEVFQDTIMGKESSAMYDNTKESWISKALKVLLFVVIFAAVCFLTAGLGAAAACIPFIGGVLSAGITSGVVVVGASVAAYSAISGAVMPEVIVLPTYYIGPEEIFSGKILLFDVNIFKPKELYVALAKVDGENITDYVYLTKEEWKEQKESGTGPYISSEYQESYYFYYKDGKSSNTDESNIVRTSVNSTAQDMKEIIAKWYYVIRNIALIGLMLVLLYIGIRILTSSVAADKAKYKQMLSDWIIAFCLIFLMHYIMVFANEFVEGITDIFASASEENSHIAVIENPPDKIVNAIGDMEIQGEQVIQDGNINWPTNLMGRVRILAQEKDGTTGYIGYVICFIILLIFTVCFGITYLKRLLYILFLTVIAPFVAMTYPLDKIRDGKAQAFDLWMKEYICNLIIQPFHLLLYTIFVTMAFELAGTNVIYSIVVLGFMMPAEKFLRKMFGFDRASTPGFLNGATGAAMTMTALNSLSRFAGKTPGGNKGIGTKGGDTSGSDNAAYLNRGKSRSVQELLNNMAGTSPNSGGTTTTTDEREQQEQQTDNSNPRPLDNGQDNSNPRPLDNGQDNSNPRPLNDENESGDNIESPDYEQLMDDWNIPEDNFDEDEIFDIPIENNDNAESPDYEQLMEDWNRPSEPTPQQGPRQEQDPQTRKELHRTSYARAFGKKWWRDTRNMTKNNLLKGTTAVGKFALGGTAAIIGASAGIASGDIGNVTKYTAAGAVAGGAIGTGLSNRAISGVKNSVASTKAAKQDIQREAYGEDYSEFLKREKDEKFKKDKEMRRLYARELGLNKKEEIDAAMHDAVKYREYGVEDNDVIIKAMRMNNGNSSNRADINRIGAAKLSMQSKSLKDLESTMKRFKETVKDPVKVKQMERDIKQINNL